jgi:hypothetical protein
MTTTPNPTPELVQTYGVGELRALATQLGLEVDKSEKKADLLPRVIERLMTVQPSENKADDDVQEQHPVVKAAAGFVTEDDIREIAAQYAHLGFRAKVEDGVFYFRCHGKEDCGNLKQPRRNVEKVAAAVARRGFAPKFAQGDDGGKYMVVG